MRHLFVQGTQRFRSTLSFLPLQSLSSVPPFLPPLHLLFAPPLWRNAITSEPNCLQRQHAHDVIGQLHVGCSKKVWGRDSTKAHAYTVQTAHVIAAPGRGQQVLQTRTLQSLSSFRNDFLCLPRLPLANVRFISTTTKTNERKGATGKQKVAAKKSNVNGININIENSNNAVRRQCTMCGTDKKKKFSKNQWKGIKNPRRCTSCTAKHLKKAKKKMQKERLRKEKETAKLLRNESCCCEYCPHSFPKLTKEHVLPKSVGGIVTIPVCWDCNQKRAALGDDPYFLEWKEKNPNVWMTAILTSKDPDKTVDWLKKWNLTYEMTSVPKDSADLANAVRLYKLAASQGDADAQRSLADMYERGDDATKGLLLSWRLCILRDTLQTLQLDGDAPWWPGAM